MVLTALAKDPADRYQSAAAMAQDLNRIVTDAGSAPLNAARGGSPTDRLPDSIPTGAATVPMAPAARRRPGWISWALVAALGIIALVAVALWPRATDLLKQAEEVLRAAQEGKAEDVDKKLQDLQRKTDEQIDTGKIRGPAVGQVRQAVAQFSQAVRSR